MTYVKLFIILSISTYKEKHLEYIKSFLKLRKKVNIDFDIHLFRRLSERNVDERYIETTLRDGKINYDKCEQLSNKSYDKICTYRYFGKEKITIEIIVLFHESFLTAEVRTVWVHKGRKEKKQRRNV